MISADVACDKLDPLTTGFFHHQVVAFFTTAFARPSVSSTSRRIFLSTKDRGCWLDLFKRRSGRETFITRLPSKPVIVR